MALSDLVQQLGASDASTGQLTLTGTYHNLLIADCPFGSSFVEELCRSCLYDHVILDSVASKQGQSVLDRLRPTEAHPSGMGQLETVALVFDRPSVNTPDIVATTLTSFVFSGGEYGSGRYDSSLNIYFVNDTFKDLTLFSWDHFSFLDQEGFHRLISDDERVLLAITALSDFVQENGTSTSPYDLDSLASSRFMRYYDIFYWGCTIPLRTNNFFRVLGLYKRMQDFTDGVPDLNKKAFTSFSLAFEDLLYHRLFSEISQFEEMYRQRCKRRPPFYFKPNVPKKDGLLPLLFFGGKPLEILPGALATLRRQSDFQRLLEDH